KMNIFGDWTSANKKLAKYYRGGPFKNYEEVVKIMNSAKIILNIHGLQGQAHYDASSRIFESAGCGVFQLADYNEGIIDCFEPGKEIVCFKTKEELRDLVKYYLANTKEREEIAKAGQERAYRDHTFKKRMQELLEKIQK
ncbi:MAG: glycosyltransferase, partial [Candidatus Firestonebacteria bacterium]